MIFLRFAAVDAAIFDSFRKRIHAFALTQQSSP